MSEGMLGRLPLSAVRGPVDALYDNLASAKGEQVLAELKRFNKQQACYVSASTPLTYPLYEQFEFDTERYDIYGDGRPRITSIDPTRLVLLKNPRARTSSQILLGVEGFRALWAHRLYLPAAWKERLPRDKFKCLCFDGDVIRSKQNGSRKALWMCFDRRWHNYLTEFDSIRSHVDFSVALEV